MSHFAEVQVKYGWTRQSSQVAMPAYDIILEYYIPLRELSFTIAAFKI